MQIYGPSQLHGPQGITPRTRAGRLSPPPGPRPRRSPTKSTSPKPLSSSSRSSSFPTSARIAWQRFASRSPPARTRPGQAQRRRRAPARRDRVDISCRGMVRHGAPDLRLSARRTPRHCHGGVSRRSGTPRLTAGIADGNTRLARGPQGRQVRRADLQFPKPRYWPSLPLRGGGDDDAFSGELGNHRMPIFPLGPCHGHCLDGG